ncbi:Aldehyde/histidinol dehydrogenase [Aspergillus undulatus]|uniref:Aldehyde/histidinol dehydrogenase n=1 Tax=Aspergillus undulatus TaxID=1810928 RepID=UPI003CCD3C8E
MDFSLRRRESYKGKHVSALPTPSLVISLPILVDNIHRLLVDSREVTRMMLDEGTHNRIVASTVCESEGALLLVEEEIFEECLYGLPITENALARLASLFHKVRILLMLDNEEQIDLLEQFTSRNEGFRTWQVFIKIDIGLSRASLPSGSTSLPDLVKRVENRKSTQAVPQDELGGLLRVLKLANNSGGPLVLSIGSTPTAHSIKAITAGLPSHYILELQAGPYVLSLLGISNYSDYHYHCTLGNFPANGLQQVSTGLGDRSQQAIRILILANICSVYPERNEALGGRALRESTASRFLPVNLELGGNDPAYVQLDADLRYVVEQSVGGAAFNAGQSCCAIERVYIQQDIYKANAENQKELAAYMLVDPADKTTNVGPVISRAAQKNVNAQIQDRSAGALSMQRHPTLLLRTLQQTELHCAYDSDKIASDEEAVKWMNDSDYGPTASVLTKDPKADESLLRVLEAGTIFINRCNYPNPNSGKGFTLGPQAFEPFAKYKGYHIREKQAYCY